MSGKYNTAISNGAAEDVFVANRSISELSCDFLGPLSGTGQYLCVIIDDYSRFPVIKVINLTSTSAVIPVFDKLFSFVGTISMVIRTDNGPPFNGQDWVNFAEHMGFKHRRVTPLWQNDYPQRLVFQEAVIERAARTTKKGKGGVGRQRNR